MLIVYKKKGKGKNEIPGKNLFDWTLIMSFKSLKWVKRKFFFCLTYCRFSGKQENILCAKRVSSSFSYDFPSVTFDIFSFIFTHPNIPQVYSKESEEVNNTTHFVVFFSFLN